MEAIKSVGPQVRLVGHGWDCDGTWLECLDRLWCGVVFHDLDLIEETLVELWPAVPAFRRYGTRRNA